MIRICPQCNEGSIIVWSLIYAGVVSPVECNECHARVVLNWKYSAFQGIFSMVVLIAGLYLYYMFGNLYLTIIMILSWILLTYWLAKTLPIEIRNNKGQDKS